MYMGHIEHTLGAYRRLFREHECAVRIDQIKKTKSAAETEAPMGMHKTASSRAALLVPMVALLVASSTQVAAADDGDEKNEYMQQLKEQISKRLVERMEQAGVHTDTQGTESNPTSASCEWQNGSSESSQCNLNVRMPF